MFPLVEPRQRPERFRLNRHHELAEISAFLGLGGLGDVGSAKFPDARKLLGEAPHDGTLTNMEPESDWVWVPQLGRWGVSLGGTDESIDSASLVAALNGSPSAWLAGWVRRVAGQSQAIGLSGPSTATRFNILWYNNNIIYAQVRDGWDCFFAGTISGWHHVAMSFAGTRPTLWIDGVATALNGTSTYPAALTTGGSAISGYDGMWGYLAADIADLLVGKATLSNSLAATLANPADPMLGGLILPPHRMSFPAAVAEEPAITYRNLIIGGGVY